MITKIKINGFKSLESFELSLHSGVNILVGPNGSGKTNIISFFEFISFLARYDLSEAISIMGGAGTIFRKIETNAFLNKIDAEIHGNIGFYGNRSVEYIYSFRIKLTDSGDAVYFSNQDFMFKIIDSRKEPPKSQPSWDLRISQSTNEKLETKVRIHNLDRRKMRTRMFMRDSETKKKFISDLEKFLRKSLSGESLVPIISRFVMEARTIRQEMVGGEAFNIIPTKVRVPEDRAAKPIIKKDGTGLSATLYAITKEKLSRDIKLFSPLEIRSNRLRSTTIGEILKFVNLANTSIKGIEVQSDPFDNRIQVRCRIQSGSYSALLPLSSMSDGTIKWITLITAILTSSSIFSIEEPENYLHPLMRSEILKIMRSNYEKSNKFILLTTHSETLLNSANPEEVIVVSFKEGRTIAKRVENAKVLKNEIQETGFGLGYYYLAGELDDE